MKLTDDKPALILACVITAVWVIGFFVDMFVPTFDPPVIIGPLMLSTAGYIFGKGAITGRGKEKDTPPPKEETL